LLKTIDKVTTLEAIFEPEKLVLFDESEEHIHVPKDRIKMDFILSEPKLESVCSRRFIETNSEKQQLHKHHEDDRLLPDLKIVCVTEDIVKESLTNVKCFLSECSHSKKANSLLILCPFAAAISSLQSVSADSLTPASVTRSPTIKFKTLSIC